MAHETALAMIQQERARQISAEGWTPEHDDEHGDGQLLRAAVIYLHWGTDRAAPLASDGRPVGWPWDKEWWKPKDRERNLVRAGALAQAEKERLERAGRSAAHADHKLQLATAALDALLAG